jgi:hypothetical protein
MRQIEVAVNTPLVVFLGGKFSSKNVKLKLYILGHGCTFWGFNLTSQSHAKKNKIQRLYRSLSSARRFQKGNLCCLTKKNNFYKILLWIIK